MTLPATLLVPEFLRLEQSEIHRLLHVLRDPLTTHVYMLLLAHSDFKTGEFLGGYHRLMELCTPPIPERGRRRPGPSYEQLRRAVRDLVAIVLAWRDNAQNAAQGQLRLKVLPREKKPTPTPLTNRVNHRVIKALNLDSMRVVASPMDDLAQDKTQGYQGGINTPISPQNGTYPQTATPEAKKAGIAALKALKDSFNRPPEGAVKTPKAHGRVAASRLTPGQTTEIST